MFNKVIIIKKYIMNINKGVLFSMIVMLLFSNNMFAEEYSPEKGFPNIVIDNKIDINLNIEIGGQKVTVLGKSTKLVKGQGLARKGTSATISVAQYDTDKASFKPTTIGTINFDWEKVTSGESKVTLGFLKEFHIWESYAMQLRITYTYIQNDDRGTIIIKYEKEPASSGSGGVTPGQAALDFLKGFL